MVLCGKSQYVNFSIDNSVSRIMRSDWWRFFCPSLPISTIKFFFPKNVLKVLVKFGCNYCDLIRNLDYYFL